MRIVHLAAGAGAMYCGACARDAALARALIARGHEVCLIPLYTPLKPEHYEALPIEDVRFGALNVYLQQLSGSFARLPRPLARSLDNPRLLRWMSGFAVETDPAQLGPMTVSMLAGADGRQRVELARLLDFIETQPRPDVITITNSLLSGVAPEIKRRLRLPIVCELKGEDGFIASIPEPHRSEALALLRRNAASIDRFIAPSRDYANHMAEYLNAPRDRIEVIPSGIDVALFRRPGPRVSEPFTVGYLSAITPRKGLHVLLDAFERLIAEGRNARLRIAGRVLNRRYARELTGRTRAHELMGRIEFLGELDPNAKIAFLHSLSVLVQPSILPEALGTVALEAQAAGLPVVAPSEGIFPEMLGRTSGGVLFPPGDAQALAEALAGLMDDPERTEMLARSGEKAVAEHHAPDAVAGEMLRVLDEVIATRA